MAGLFIHTVVIQVEVRQLLLQILIRQKLKWAVPQNFLWRQLGSGNQLSWSTSSFTPALCWRLLDQRCSFDHRGPLDVLLIIMGLSFDRSTLLPLSAFNIPDSSPRPGGATKEGCSLLLRVESDMRAPGMSSSFEDHNIQNTFHMQTFTAS